MENNILNWLISLVDGKTYWVIGDGIYAEGDLVNNIYSELSLELREKIINNAKSNVL